MTPLRYILASVAHYRFAYLGVLAGTILGATVLLGALFAGDSVAASLRRIGEQRVGRATHLVSSGDRFFQAVWAQEYARTARVRTAPLMLARGTATHGSTRAAANQVQLVGVTDAFWQLAPTPATVAFEPAESGVAINTALARRLQLGVGDTLIVRLQKPGILAGNAPVAGAEPTLESLRCTVSQVLTDASFGRFSLEATQVASPSVFLPIARLQQSLERPGKANVLLIEAGETEPPALASALRPSLRLPDYELRLKWLETAGAFEVSSDRIFIDAEMAASIEAALAAQPVVSYLVNELRVGDRTTPYSMVTAVTPAAAPFLPHDVGPRDLVMNSWLAEDLQARPGDDVQLTFFQTGEGGALIEKTATFRTRATVPLEGLAADRAWMPEFPGITDTNNQSDWDPGLPLKLERIRDQDERYWDDYRGAPKAFLSLQAGRELWSTRWGNTTALRIARPRDAEAEVTAQVLAALRPEMHQIVLRDLRSATTTSAQSAVDFGGLFIGMSFFLIIAALGLVAMLFQFVLLQRNREDALLGAIGLSARQLLRWRLGEALALLAIGTVVGLAVATLYTRGILRFLESIWAQQSAGSLFIFAANPRSVAIGGGAFLLFSLVALGMAIRGQTRRALSIRLTAQGEQTVPLARVRRRSFILAMIAGLVAAGALSVSGRALPPQAAFYLAGFALLTSGLALCRAWLASTKPDRTHHTFDARLLGRLNLRARRSRSLTVVGLIATAVFMVLSVASFRKHVGADWQKVDSGTGGFAFWVETTTPQNLPRDGQSRGFEIFGRQGAELGAIVSLRAGVGDNVNCFNLNSTTQPQLLAVNPALLAERSAFPLKLASPPKEAGWLALRAGASYQAGAIPALVDETTLLWALKRKVGDVLAYTDEKGRAFEVQIVGTIQDSIFQGYVIIDEGRFLEKFPSHAGYSIFLLDAKPDAPLADLRSRLASALIDAGGRVELTRDVLAAFHQIENTYIGIFNVLGSLGVILGSLGLAIVIARNLRERRGEFAVMAAMGIPARVVRGVVFFEFGRLVVWGIAIGGAASAVAVWPNLTALPAAPTVALVSALLAGIVGLNLASGWLVFRWSMRNLRPSVAQQGA